MGKLRHGAALQWETHGVTLTPPPPPVPQHWDQCPGHTGPQKGLCCLICGRGMSANKGGRSSAVAVPGFWGSLGVGGGVHGVLSTAPPLPLLAPSASCMPRLRLCPAVPKPGAFLGKNVKAVEFGRMWRLTVTGPLRCGVGGGAAGGGQRGVTGGVTSEGMVAPWVPLRADGPGAEPGGRDVG